MDRWMFRVTSVIVSFDPQKMRKQMVGMIQMMQTRKKSGKTNLSAIEVSTPSNPVVYRRKKFRGRVTKQKTAHRHLRSASSHGPLLGLLLRLLLRSSPHSLPDVGAKESRRSRKHGQSPCSATSTLIIDTIRIGELLYRCFGSVQMDDGVFVTR